MLAASPASRVAWLVLRGGVGGSHAGGSLVPEPLGDAEPMLLPSQMYFRDLRSICHRGVGLREGAASEESARILLPMPLLILCGSGKAAAALQPPPAPLLTGWENKQHLRLPHTRHATPGRLALKTFVFFFHPWHPGAANPGGFLGSPRIPTEPPNHTGFQRFP